MSVWRLQTVWMAASNDPFGAAILLVWSRHSYRGLRGWVLGRVVYPPMPPFIGGSKGRYTPQGPEDGDAS